MTEKMADVLELSPGDRFTLKISMIRLPNLPSPTLRKIMWAATFIWINLYIGRLSAALIITVIWCSLE